MFQALGTSSSALSSEAWMSAGYCTTCGEAAPTRDRAADAAMRAQYTSSLKSPSLGRPAKWPAAASASANCRKRAGLKEAAQGRVGGRGEKVGGEEGGRAEGSACAGEGGREGSRARHSALALAYRYSVSHARARGLSACDCDAPFVLK